jgi:hypothetical protein
MVVLKEPLGAAERMCTESAFFTQMDCCRYHIQQFGMDNLYQAVIVSVVHRHADQRWAQHGKAFFSVDEIPSGLSILNHFPPKA